MIFAATSDDVAIAFIELGAIVLGLAVLARLSDRVGVSPIPAYLVAGLLFGDGGLATPELSSDFLHLAAEIGVVLLLLTLGLEYTPDEFRDGLRRNGRAGFVDLLLNALPGVAAAFLLGWGPEEAVLLGRDHLHLVVGSDLEGPHRPRPDRATARRRRSSASSCSRTSAMTVYLPVAAVVIAGDEIDDAALTIAIAVVGHACSRSSARCGTGIT